MNLKIVFPLLGVLMFIMLGYSTNVFAELTIGNYSLQNKERINRYEYSYTYKADITNTADNVINTTATVISLSSQTTVTVNSINFGDIGIGKTVTSSDTFTITQDRRFPFDPNDLQWDISAFPATGSIVGIITSDNITSFDDVTVSIQFTSSAFETSTIANSDGTFQATDLPLDGIFFLTAINSSGASGSLQSSISNNNPNASLSIMISDAGSGSISGNISSFQNELITGSIVTILFPETKKTESTETDLSGNYLFSNLPLDGTVIVIAFDPNNTSTASSSTFITNSSPIATLNLTLPAPPIINEELLNPDFSNTLSKWETSGTVSIVNRDIFFGSQN